MQELWGLPDFQAPASGGSMEIYAAFQRGANLLFPDRLVVAERPDGTPDFQLVLARRANALDPQGSYGALELRLARHTLADEALSFLRARDPRATLAPAVFASGTVRMAPVGQAVELPAELLAPVPLGMNGIDAVRWTARLALSTAELLRGALRGGALLLQAIAEVEVLGVAPRVATTVKFSSVELLGALLQGAATRRISREQLVAAFLEQRASLPLDTAPDVTPSDTQHFAEAMADRLRVRFASGVAGGLVEFPPAEQLAAGSFTWDLAQPIAAPRSWSFTLDPLAAARDLVRSGNAGALVREVTIPTLHVGFWDLTVSATLPRARQGILELGVTVEAPARPPFRIDAVEETLDLVEPADQASVQVRLAPSEQLAYTYAPFVALKVGRGVKRLDGAPVDHTGGWVSLYARDFPVALVPVSAAPGLLALATLAGRLRYRAVEGVVDEEFSLSAAQPSVTLALPNDATEAAISMIARALDGSAAIALAPFPAGGALHLDLATFRSYGPQRVALACRFAPGTDFFAIDLLPEGRAETAEQITLLHLSPAQPRAEWGYVSPSPFHGGYRFRVHADGAAWSPLQPPSAPLTLDAADPVIPRPPAVLDVRGVHLYTTPDDGSTVYYVPGEPTAARAAQWSASAAATLDLTARWDLDDALRAALAAELAKWPALAAAALEFAPVGVPSVELALGDGAGHFTTLATTDAATLPPYASSFSVAVSAAQKAPIAAALAGTPGVLKVTYRVALLPEVAATFPEAPAFLERGADVVTWSTR